MSASSYSGDFIVSDDDDVVYPPSDEELLSSPVYVSFSDLSDFESDVGRARDSTSASSTTAAEPVALALRRARRQEEFYEDVIERVLREDEPREGERLATDEELRHYYEALMRHYISFLSEHRRALTGALEGDPTAPANARELTDYTVSQMDALNFSYLTHLRRLRAALADQRGVTYSMTVAYRVQLGDPKIKNLDMSADGEYAEVDPRDVIAEGFVGRSREVSRLSFRGRRLPIDPYLAALADQLRQNTWMNEIDASAANLGQRGVDILMRAFYDQQTSRARTRYGNSTLKSLIVGENSPADVFNGRVLSQMLRENDSIMSLSLRSLKIQHGAMRSLIEALRINQTLADLDLSGNRIGVSYKGRSFNEFCEMLSGYNRTLRSINLSSAGLRFVDIETLGAALGANNSVRSLDISSNNLSPAADAIASVIENASSLISLDFSNCKFEGGQMTLITAALRANPDRLVHLSLSANNFMDIEEAVENLSVYIGESKRLRSLNAGSSGINYLLLRKHLVPGLARNRNITQLNVENTFFGETAFGALGEALQTNRWLRELNVSRCIFTPKGLREFARLFESEANSVTRFEARQCVIDDSGAAGLFESIQKGRGIEHIDVSRNSIGRVIVTEDEGMGDARVVRRSNAAALSVARMIATSRVLRHLNLSVNPLDDEHLAIIGNSLRHSRSLRYLNVRGNMSSEEGELHLIDALEQSTSIVEFPLSSDQDPIDAGIRERVRRITERNKHRRANVGISLASMALLAARAVPSAEMLGAVPPNLVRISQARLEREMAQ